MPTIFITGANRGLGLEIAKQYSGDGWKVIACCRDPENAEQLKSLANESNDNLKTYKLDVNDQHNLGDLARLIQNEPIDILFNNAGIFGGDNKDIYDIVCDKWCSVFQTNVVAPTMIIRALVSNVEKSNLKIIANMSSIMGSIALNDDEENYIYKSSKAALNSVTKTLANELGRKKIIVVALHPGWVKTDMGGPNAEIDVIESASGLRRVLSLIDRKYNGGFLDYHGNLLPW